MKKIIIAGLSLLTLSILALGLFYSLKTKPRNGQFIKENEFNRNHDKQLQWPPLTDCQLAKERARSDFKRSDYSFHSEEFLPTENTYTYVLREYYNINWFFTDSLDYYNCYDFVMTELLKAKYGKKFLEKATHISDSLENTNNWHHDTQFPGGMKALYKFFSARLNSDSVKIDSVKTKTTIYIQFVISTSGKVSNPIILRGINKKINDKVIEVAKQMPNWEPQYMYGKPIRIGYQIPLFVDYK